MCIAIEISREDNAMDNGIIIHLGAMNWGKRASEYPRPACGATPTAFNPTGDVEKFDSDMQNWAFDPTPYCSDCRLALGR